MINFYNYIHTTITKEGSDELIVWPHTTPENSSVHTNKDLLREISGYRQQLMDKKIKAGETILLAMPVSIAAINTLLAIQSIGAIPVLPPANSGLLMFISIIRKQKIKAVVTETNIGLLYSLALKSAGIKCIQLNNPGSETVVWKPVLVPTEQAALITHSSGSTGKPKATCRSHRVLSAQHLVLKKIFPPWKNQRDFPLFPNIILHNLAAGVTSILPAIPDFQLTSFDPARITEQLQSAHIDTLTGNVFYFRKILEYCKNHQQTFPLVKAVGIGGSPVPESLADGVRQCFTNSDCYIIYGSSEAEPISIRKINNTIENPLNGYAVGTPCEDLNIRINATTDIQTAHGLFVTGEIEVKGAHVATLRKDGWFKTTDIGYLTAGNKLYLTARKGNERPHNALQHFQIEHLLLQNGVKNTGVISAFKGFNIYIEGFADKEEIWQLLNKHLPHGTIQDIYFRSRIPMDSRHHSKVLYHKLK